MKLKRRNNLLKTIALVMAGAPVVLASVPRSNDIANDTAIYQNLHEIKVQKVKAINFDSDLARLSAQEKSHREVLPLKLTAPMERIQSTPYRAGSYKKSSAESHKRFKRSK